MTDNDSNFKTLPLFVDVNIRVSMEGNRMLRAILSLSPTSLQFLSPALMSPSIRIIFGLVLCPSMHVSNGILMPALSKWSILDLSKKIPADLLDTEGYIILEPSLATIVSPALMSPSTHIISVLVLCPSVHVSDGVLTPALSKWSVLDR